MVSLNVTFLPFYTDADMTTLGGASVAVVHNTTKGTYYCTIQDAIDDAGTGGETILVGNGTFYENIIINKANLTLQNSSSPVIDGSGTGNVVTITANNVNMSGFTVQNSNYTYPDPVYSGILIDGATGCNIHGNNLDHNANGIMVQNSTGPNTLDNNVITNNSWNGIYVLASNSVTITNTTITTMGYSGILLESGVTGCVVGSSGNPNTISGVPSYGIGLFGSTTGNTISYNNLQNCGTNAGSGWGIYATSSLSNIFDHNTISNCASVGISLVRQDDTYTASNGNTISNNNISHTGNNAINVDFASYNNSITGNTISNCNYPGWTPSIAGVDAGDPAWGIVFLRGAHDNTATGNDISSSDVGIENWSDAGTGNVATGNKIHGNFYGLHNAAGTAMTATGNWWGAASGPTTSQNNPSTNPCGTGDMVSLYVTFLPFYIDAGMATLGGASVAVVHNTTKGTYYCTIQAAINDANASGDVITVSAGTYNEAIHITKPLTIDGDGPDLTILSSNSLYMVSVEADDVTIKDIAITSPLYNGVGDASEILVSTAGHKSNLHITNVKVHDIGMPGRVNTDGTQGINIGPINGLEIDHSEIYNIIDNNVGSASFWHYNVGQQPGRCRKR